MTSSARLVSEVTELTVDDAARPAGGDDTAEFVLARAADAHTAAVVGKNVEFLDIVDGFACHYRMHTAGVVADHPTDRAVLVGRGVGSESQAVLFRGVVEVVTNNSGLDTGEPVDGVKREEPVQALGKLDHHGDITVATTSSMDSGTTMPIGGWR